LLRTLIQRALQSVGVAFTMSVIVFAGVNLIGNPILLLMPPDATQADIDAAIHHFGLDQPVAEQYGRFLLNVLHGDLGTSFVSGQSALGLIVQRFPATLELAVTALIASIVIGIPLGIAVGYYHQRAWSRAVMTGSVFGYSMPSFWVALMLIMLFAVQLGWLPSGGRGETATVLGITSSFFTLNGLLHLLLPGLTLALLKVSLAIRITAAGVREAMQLDYVRFARAKGLGEGRILFVHIAKNIMIPVVTVLGLEFGNIVAFSLVTETVFRWPGSGKLLIDSIRQLDRPVIVAYMICIVLMFIAINFLVDMIYMLFDPRLGLSGSR
jgi:peptide/nickel transport system permease protein